MDEPEHTILWIFIHISLTFLLYVPIFLSTIFLLIPRKHSSRLSEEDTPELKRKIINSKKGNCCAFDCCSLNIQTYTAKNFDPNLPTIIYIHGHGASFIKKRKNVIASPWLKYGKQMNEKGYNIFGIDIRNHGLSSNSIPFGFGNTEKWDVKLAIEYIQAKTNAPIFVHGSSLGCVHSILALGTFENLLIDGLIIDSAPAALDPTLLQVWAGRICFHPKCIPQLIIYPMVFWFKILLFLLSCGTCMVNPVDIAKFVKCDVLHTHGHKDPTVPFIVAKSLGNEFENRKNEFSYTFIEYNGGHTDPHLHLDYIKICEEFIANIVKKKTDKGVEL